MRAFLLSAALILQACSSVVEPAPAEVVVPDSVTVIGPGGTVTIGSADFTSRTTLVLSIHGDEHLFEGMPLSQILAAVGAPTGRDLRGNELSSVVLITCRDGYQVAFSLAEIDPGMTTRQVILADSMDAAAIGPEDGPYRLVAEGDLRPARSARQVVRIEVLRLGEMKPPSH